MAGEQRTASAVLPTRRVGGAMQPLWKVTACLCCLWILSLLYGELIAFWIPIWTCPWPSLSRDHRVDSTVKFKKVVAIADPQLTDRTTHGMESDSFALKATQFYSDLYMRRAFRTTVLSLKPDDIIFLGDYLDGGPYLSDAEYSESLKRFWHIFDQSGKGARLHSKIPFHFLSGNHDLGYAGFISENPKVLERHVRAFGPVEHTDRIGTIEFVFVDAQSLDGNVMEERTNNAWGFVQNISSETYSTHPKVLLSHVPLYRPDNTPCGVLRSSQLINQRISWSRSGFPKIVYQNYLSEDTTVKLLDFLKPVLVLSGHDHDQCTLKHRTPSVSVIEHTVGSFSWQNGNLFPSFLLLSVRDSSSSNEEGILSSQLCFLPYQTLIYVWYAVLFAFSIAALLAWPTHGIDWESSFGKLLCQIMTCFSDIRHHVKEKEDDANHDYEMVWDAEGSMHLIKKTAVQPESKFGRNQTAARTTAVSQSVIKRTAALETPNMSLIPEIVAEHSKLEGPVTIGRQSKTYLRRLKQVAGPLVVLTTVNAGLYIMFMMNDWTGV